MKKRDRRKDTERGKEREAGFGRRCGINRRTCMNGRVRLRVVHVYYGIDLKEFALSVARDSN